MYRMLMPVYSHAKFAKNGTELFFVSWDEVAQVHSMDEARAFARSCSPWLVGWVLEKMS